MDVKIDDALQVHDAAAGSGEEFEHLFASKPHPSGAKNALFLVHTRLPGSGEEVELVLELPVAEPRL